MPRPAVAEQSLEEHASQRARSWILLELIIGYSLILATIWTPRPIQGWLWWISAAWIIASSWWSFPGWQAMGFRRAGFVASLWVVAAAVIFSAVSVIVAIHLHSLRIPHTARGWILAWGGYTVWSFAQQYLLQGYFLFRFLRLLPRREGAALASAVIFAAAHLPNPVLTAVTLIWGGVATFVFLRCRNLYPLMLAHAILGVSLAITVPGPQIHNMRVGLGYLRYHAPANTGPPLIDPATGRIR
jgi:membrane protease YdiL (CAAX protease family)